MFCIFHKNNSNNLEENKKEEKEPINIELTEKKVHYNDENAIDSKWSDLTEEDEEDIALANFIESLKKSKLMRIFFPKK